MVSPNAIDNVRRRALSVVNTHFDKIGEVLNGNRT